jgi:hypothetical protein
MSDDEADWLSIDVPSVKVPKAVVENSPKYQALVAALVPLSPKQKSYVRALAAAHYVPAQALKKLQAAGMEISERTIYRWQTDDKVKRAVALYREAASEFAGIDSLSVMLRVSAWADYCFEEVDLFSRDGKPLGRGKRDAVSGLKALELLGKHTGAIKPADNRSTTINNNAPAQFVYQIVSSKEGAPAEQIAGSGAVIDVEVKEVPKDE